MQVGPLPWKDIDPMKVTLINPPQLNVLDDRQYPPLGLLYLAASLREQGIAVNIVDLASVPPEAWPERINDDAGIYGIECFTPSIGHVKTIIGICREKNGGCLTVVGGPHASAVPESALAGTGCDAVFAGEGEAAFVDFVKQYEKTGRFEPIVRGAQIKDLDALPLPARDLVDLDSYTATLYGRKTAGMLTSRGCPYSCAFCDNKGVFGNGVRYRSVESVAEEIKALRERHGYGSVFIYDDIFAIHKKRLARILPVLKAHDLRFLCDGRVNMISRELVRMLYDGGCVKIAYGIESGSQKVLDLMNKKTTVQQCIDAIKMAKDAGIFVKCYFIFGLPGEDASTVEETKRLIELAEPDQANLYTFVPYPGSAIWRNPERFGITITNRDFENYFMISTDGTGGVNYRIDGLSEDRYFELRDDLMAFIRSRKINRPEGSSNI